MPNQTPSLVHLSEMSMDTCVTKRQLLSDISKVFDVIGWFVPTSVHMKILLQRTWELDLGWEDPVPEHLLHTWHDWRSELKQLLQQGIPRSVNHTSGTASAMLLRRHIMPEWFTCRWIAAPRLSGCRKDESSTHQEAHYSKAGTLWCCDSHQVDTTCKGDSGHPSH